MKRIVAALAIVGAFGTQALAIVPAYVCDLQGNIYNFDLATGNKALLGNANDPVVVTALAYSPGGVLYGADAAGNLLNISTINGQGTVIGNMGIGAVEGLDFRGNTLLASNTAANVSIFSVNVITAGATPMITATSATGLVHSFATDPSGSTTVYLLNDAPNPDFYTKMDLVTGVVTPVAALPNTIQRGIDWGNDGNLYSVAGAGRLYRINPITGSTNLIAFTGQNDWSGLTAVPVPEPASMACLGIGAMALLRKRRKSARK